MRTDCVVLIGPVRQEILTGIRDAAQYERLRDQLRSFDDQPIDTSDYEQAAQFSNLCRAAGVAGSPVDFLICAVAAGAYLPIFTTDPDFTRYAAHLPIRLYKP